MEKHTSKWVQRERRYSDGWIFLPSCTKKIRYDEETKNQKIREIEDKLRAESEIDVSSGHCFCLFDKPSACVEVINIFKYFCLTQERTSMQTSTS